MGFRDLPPHTLMISKPPEGAPRGPMDGGYPLAVEAQFHSGQASRGLSGAEERRILFRDACASNSNLDEYRSSTVEAHTDRRMSRPGNRVV